MRLSKEQMDSIIIRADSSSTIGTGHIMRCLVLAKQYPEHNIIFAARNLSGNINNKIIDSGFQLEILESDNIGGLIALINRFSPKFLIIDHYGIDAAAEKHIKEQCDIKIMSLDDTYLPHHCDILLNHNIYAEEIRYTGIVPNGCEIRCGKRYTLIRDEFITAKSRPSESVRDTFTFFVSLGGADRDNITLDVLKALSLINDIEIVAVTTSSNVNISALTDYIAGTQNIKLHIDSMLIAELINNADTAVVSPSVILNEVFFMEKPFIAIKTADNQSEMINFLNSNRYDVLESFSENSFIALAKRKILLNGITMTNFTNMSQDESADVLSWRNHRDVRKWMFNSDEIPLDAHIQFIHRLNSLNDRIYFLIKQSQRPIGVIDFTEIDYNEKSAHMGIYVKPGERGKGSILMTLIAEYAFKELKIDTIFSEVFEENTPAVELYKKNNFVITGKRDYNTRSLIIMELKREDWQF